MPPLLIETKEVRDEVHAIRKVRPIVRATADQTIRSQVDLREHFSQPGIGDLPQHIGKLARQVSTQAKRLGAGQMQRHQMLGDDLANDPIGNIDKAFNDNIEIALVI